MQSLPEQPGKSNVIVSSTRTLDVAPQLAMHNRKFASDRMSVVVPDFDMLSSASAIQHETQISCINLLVQH